MSQLDQNNNFGTVHQHFGDEVYTNGGDYVQGGKYVGYTAEQVSIIVTATIAEISRDRQPKIYDGRRPYPGLTSFKERDAEFFFGREKLVERLVTRVGQMGSERFLCITGASGSGKSSLVRAGLIKHLKQGALEGSTDWKYAEFTPLGDPIGQLANALARLTGLRDVADRFLQIYSDDPDALQSVIAPAFDSLSQRAVLLIDQFEELFTQTRDENARKAFIVQLTRATRATEGRVTVTVALRSDFISPCLAYKDLSELMRDGFEPVSAMSPDELTRAIALPALEVGLAIDPKLISQVIVDMRGEPGALPLMQFALRDLLQAKGLKRGDVAELTLNDYLVRGGIHRALQRHADEAFAQLTPEQQALARGVFSRLITPGRGALDTRRTAPFDQLVPVGQDAQTVQAVVQTLTDARLLTTDASTTDEGGAGLRTVTITHEALLEAWPWLLQLRKERRAEIELQNEIADDARKWDESGRDEGYLYRGGQLTTVTEALTAGRLALDERSLWFVQVAQTAEAARAAEAEANMRRATELGAQRRSGRRLRVLATGLVVAALVAAGLAGAAAYQSGLTAQARGVAERAKETAVAAQAIEQTLRVNEAEARAKAQASEQNALYASNIALAYRFWSNGQIIQMKDALRNSAPSDSSPDLRSFEWRYLSQLANQDRLTLCPKSQGTMLTAPFSGVGDVAYSPDGSLIVEVRNDGVLTIRDAYTGEEQRSFVPHKYGTAVVMFALDSPTTFLTVGSSDGAIKLWDARSGKMVRELTTGGGQIVSSEHKGTPFDASISADGRKLVLLIQPGQGAIDGSFSTLMYLSWQVHIIDLATGIEAIWNDDVRSLAVSPQGDRIALGISKQIIIKDRKTGKKKQEFNLTVDYAGELAFSRNGKLLAVGGDSIQIWDTETGLQLTRLVGHRSRVTDLRFSSDDAILASAGADNTIILWNAQDFTQQAVFIGHEQHINAIDFSPDNSQLVSSAADNCIKVWDVYAALQPHVMTGNSFVFAPDGNRLFVWDNALLDGRVVANGLGRFGHMADPIGWRFTVQGESFDSYHEILFSPDGRYFYTLPDIHVFEANSLRRIADLEGESPGIFGDGQFVVAHSEGELLVYQTSDWRVNRRLRTSKGKITTISGHPGSNLLAVAYAQGAIEVWDTATWTVKNSTSFDAKAEDNDRSQINVLRFSPDGEQILVLFASNRAILWSAKSGERTLILEGRAGQSYLFDPPAISFSPDGQWLAIVDSSSLKPQVWNAQTGELQATLLGHTSEVSSIAISPDGRTVATGSNDTTIKLWNLSTGQEMLTLEANLGRVISLGFTPDGKTLVSSHWGDEYRSLKVWRTLTDGELLLRAIQRIDPERGRSVTKMAIEAKEEQLAKAVSDFLAAHSDVWSNPSPSADQIMAAALMQNAKSSALAGDFANTRTLLEHLVQRQPIGTLPVNEQVRRYFSAIYDNSLALAESMLEKEDESSLTQAEQIVGEPIRRGLLEGSTSNLLNVYYLLAQAYQQQGDMRSAASEMAMYVRAQESSRGKAQELTLDTSLTLSMTRGLTYYLPMHAKAGDSLDLLVTSEDGVDPLMVLLAPNGIRLSFCDDLSSSDRNAAIKDYMVDETGTYTLVVTHAGGGSEGTIEVNVKANTSN